MRKVAQKIIETAIRESMPGEAVERAVCRMKADPSGRLVLVSVGKAAWEMADAASRRLGSRITDGVVITKYNHSRGNIPSIRIFEAGHPIPDENSCIATEYACSLVSDLCEKDTVLLLISGGGSALFEKPLLPLSEIADITDQLLQCGAGITEINTIRKRLSAVKGGKFAILCRPAKVFAVVLSDIIGDPLDMIASGPAYPDSSTCGDACEIAERYQLRLSKEAREALMQETPKTLDNVETCVTGSVRQMTETAQRVCREEGYEPIVLTSSLCCEAREAGSFLAAIARDHQSSATSLAFLAGGETVVHVHGNGSGGRNQEIALSAAAGLGDCRDTCVFSFGSDGTDGPTDAAGGYADENTARLLAEKKIDIRSMLQNNDAYHALKQSDGLIITGPTGTNVNDLSVVLIRRQREP